MDPEYPQNPDDIAGQMDETSNLEKAKLAIYQAILGTEPDDSEIMFQITDDDSIVVELDNSETFEFELRPRTK